ncbi:MAG: hypothetical protein HFI64_15230 [Lachnospiraceae bacterium]|nr:hypothetical protein [Lachnospiraceae bacterium]
MKCFISYTYMVLKAPMSEAKLIHILNYAVGTLAMVMGFGALYMIIYFMGR